MKRCTMIVLLAAVLMLNLCGLENCLADNGKTTVRVTSADGMFLRISGLAKLFERDHPKTTVTVIKSPAIDGDIKGVLNKTSDVAMLSRRMTSEEEQAAMEKGVELGERVIGYGGIVFLTNKNNPLNSLTVEQLQKIFKGDYDTWNQVAGPSEPIVVVIVGEKHPGTLAFMRNEFLEKSSFTPGALVVNDFPSVMKKVSETPSAIGFVRVREAFETPEAKEFAVKILDVKKSAVLSAVMPTRAHVGDGTYPIRRPYYLYYDTRTGPSVREFITFVVKKGWGPQEI